MTKTLIRGLLVEMVLHGQTPDTLWSSWCYDYLIMAGRLDRKGWERTSTSGDSDYRERVAVKMTENGYLWNQFWSRGEIINSIFYGKFKEIMSYSNKGFSEDIENMNVWL